MKKKKVPEAFMQAVRSHRHTLEKVLSGQAERKMKKVYDEAQQALVGKIRTAVRTGKGSSFTVHQQRIAMAQLREGQALIAQRLAKNMGPLSKAAQEASLHGLVGDVARLSKRFTGSEVTLPVAEASTFAGVINGRAPSLMRLHQSSMNSYGARVVGKVEQTMTLSMLQDEDPNDAIDAVADVIDGEWWQGERIVRTEMSYAYNQTHCDGIIESSKEIPELMQRWEENCDENGAPLDDRVAVDSLAMHGQVARAGGLFTMPATAPFPDAKGKTTVPAALIGLSWDAPPNRPNDRSVLSPWMEDWGVPGWIYQGGQRVWLVR